MIPPLTTIRRWLDRFGEPDHSDSDEDTDVFAALQASGDVLALHLPNGEHGYVRVRNGFIEEATLEIDDRPVHYAEPPEFSLLSPSLDCLRPAEGRRTTDRPGEVTCEDCIAIRLTRARKAGTIRSGKPAKRALAGART